ncbi:MAG TPA: SDR family oxidoreductase, partial [Acidimicrobiales bacterium]
MSTGGQHGAQRVVVVTGGGAGIGAAIAEELARAGVFVVTMDPMVKVDGSGPLKEAKPTTADLIVKAGGTARASSTSVTDEAAVRELFSGLVDEFGSLDAVVNAAGIVRPTDFATGSEDDWAAVLSVHLDGYLNVLRAALPIMAEAGRGRILGVTSGAGWRPANIGAYSCAKRAVAALTWQIGRVPPDGVTINALSPIAATRMSAAPRPANQQASGSSPTGGPAPALGSRLAAENLGPIGAYLCGEQFSWCSGQVIFSNGAEVAWIEPPRLLEAIRSRNVVSLSHVLDSVVPLVFASAEAHQTTSGATNPRFGPVYDEPGGAATATPAARWCAIVTDDTAWGAAMSEALGARGIASAGVGAWQGDAGGPTEVASGFTAAAEQLASVSRHRPLDGVVVALGGPGPGGGDGGATGGWKQILDDHAGM